MNATYIQLHINILNMKKVIFHNNILFSKLLTASVFLIFIAICFLIIVTVSVILTKISSLILVLYVATSLVTFVMYALDKSTAKAGALRTQESTLHLLALVGGWPGAMIAQQTFRHKTKKQSFRTVFWLTVLLNSGAFVWLLTLNGSMTLAFLIWDKVSH